MLRQNHQSGRTAEHQRRTSPFRQRVGTGHLSRPASPLLHLHDAPPGGLHLLLERVDGRTQLLLQTLHRFADELKAAGRSRTVVRRSGPSGAGSAAVHGPVVLVGHQLTVPAGHLVAPEAEELQRLGRVEAAELGGSDGADLLGRQRGG